MLITEIYNGQGLGNQLACYVTTRVLALDKGYNFGIMNPHKLKCLDFMELNFGLPVNGGSSPKEGAPPIELPDGIKFYYRERIVRHPNGCDIRIDDPALELVVDNTKLDGVFQSETRICHRREEIKNWLRIKPEKDCFEYSNKNICIINFRGGEYANVPHFFLNRKYWEYAIKRMLIINPKFEFIVITDDIITAKKFFPEYKVLHFDLAKDFTIIKNAHYLILSNSSFPYFATFISETIKYIVAPKFWGCHNISDGYWSCGYNIYRNYNYLDRKGKVFNFSECKDSFTEFIGNNKHLWAKKYDIISFNSELDMLEIRLNILNDYVDYFVIVEATETFSGVKKPLYYKLNKDRFSAFNHKIIHFVIEDTPKDINDKNCDQEILNLAKNSDNITHEHVCWLKEFYQKESIKKALYRLNDEDVCFVSDVDEIWNYKLEYKVNKFILKPKIDKCYINYLNLRTDENYTCFTGPIVAKYSQIKHECLNHLRTLSKMKDKYEYIENGGWHFNALGGIKEKIKAFKHPVYTKQYMLGRQKNIKIDESGLPEYIINNKNKYETYFKSPIVIRNKIKFLCKCLLAYCFFCQRLIGKKSKGFKSLFRRR